MTRPVEVERKRQLDVGDEDLERRLAALGWVPDAPATEVDTYYSRPDVDYMQTVECLRVRRRRDFSEITYKPPSTAATHSTDSVISKPETNVRMTPAHADDADQLLENIGMRRLVRVEKHRTTYRHSLHPDATVSIDSVTGVGDFVETEVISTDADMAVRTVADVESRIGVAHHPVVDLPYRDLAMNRELA